MVRTRFAPSPTGYLHVGGLRTALYNYLFTRQNDGDFLLRIEDTDQSRKVEGAVENLIETLEWAGLDIDEGVSAGGDKGPYTQSERTDLYKKHVQELVDKGHAYPCFCSEERLEELNKLQKMQGKTPGYDNKCRNISKEEAEERIENGESYVIRQKIPDDREVIVKDKIRGKVSFDTELLDDQILMKSNGFPTYHLANVIDDHYMEITHVVRGEEWLPSTPKHILLYEYFGWEPAEFAHLPLLLNDDRSKLSKRQGDVAVGDYIEKGYLKEALLNFLALLGWNPGTDQEIFSMDELIEQFSFDNVSKSGSVFNLEKLYWMNGVYIREMDPEELYEEAEPFIDSEIDWTVEEYIRILSLTQEGINILSEVNDRCKIFFKEELSIEEDAKELLSEKETKDVLKRYLEKFKNIDELTKDKFVEIGRKVQNKLDVGGKTLWVSIRAGITGEIHGPEIHKTAELLGRKRCIRRIEEALENG